MAIHLCLSFLTGQVVKGFFNKNLIFISIVDFSARSGVSCSFFILPTSMLSQTNRSQLALEQAAVYCQQNMTQFSRWTHSSCRSLNLFEKTEFLWSAFTNKLTFQIHLKCLGVLPRYQLRLSQISIIATQCLKQNNGSPHTHNCLP